MQRTDLDTPFLTIPSSGERTSSRFVRLTCSGVLIISCTIFGYSQCYAQDVADAARQEQARKQGQQKKSKHVYTDEDLKRAQILTPEDRAEVEARKTQQPPPGEENANGPLDAQALPSEEPLGDVARRYRRERELLRLQQSAQFHLPFVEETVHATPKPSVLVEPKAPVLAIPKPPVMPLRTVISIPAPPPQEEPFQPPVKRSPFARPRVFLAPQRIAPTQPSANHVTPLQPPAVSTAPARPSTIQVAPTKPAAPPPVVDLMPPNRTAPRVTPAQPGAPLVQAEPSHPSTLSVTPSKPAAPAHDFSVVPGPAPVTRVVPTQPAAPVIHAAPSAAATAAILPVIPAEPTAPRPDLTAMPSPAHSVRVVPAQPAAPVVNSMPAHQFPLAVTPAEPVAPKPDLKVMPSPAHNVRVLPTQPAAPVIASAPSKPSVLGIAPSQPSAPVVAMAPPRVTAPARTAPAGAAKLNVLTVQPGDSLWKLAQKTLGDGLRWHDLLAANPAIVDPNHIVAGSHIFLPSIATRFRTATSIIVQKGDTLSGIARAQFGHASYWSCLAHANPTIHDANLIYGGQSLLLPASCRR